MSDLVSRLRDMSACKHDDLSVGNEAADAIEQRDKWIQELQAALCRWLPNVQGTGDPVDEQCAKDALLLFGLDKCGPEHYGAQMQRELAEARLKAEKWACMAADAEAQMVKAQRDAERYRFLRGKSMLGGNQFYSRIMEIHDEEIDKARGA